MSLTRVISLKSLIDVPRESDLQLLSVSVSAKVDGFESLRGHYQQVFLFQIRPKPKNDFFLPFFATWVGRRKNARKTFRLINELLSSKLQVLNLVANL